MGLFDKKFCDICGDKIGLLGNRKLEDGNLCKNCAKKLSPWFDERRHSTVEQIRNQLAYREENKAKVASFRATRTIGRDTTKLYIDDNARKFAVYKGNDFADGNPDILDFSRALGCDLDIRENRDEIRRTVDGRSESYNPPRYDYSYDFKVTIRVDHPYFDEMKFDLNGRSVQTGEHQMSGGNLGAWNISRAGSFFGMNRGENEYNEFIQLGNELKEMIDNWKNGSAQNTASQQGEVIRYTSANPVPYFANIGGNTVMFEIRYSGSLNLSTLNPTVVQNLGGRDNFINLIKTDAIYETNEAICACAGQQVNVVLLPTKSEEIAQRIKSALEEKWSSHYRVDIESIAIEGLTMTEESQKIYNQLKSAQVALEPDRQDNTPLSVPAADPDHVCPFCDTPNTSKFCPNCGAKQY